MRNLSALFVHILAISACGKRLNVAPADGGSSPRVDSTVPPVATFAESVVDAGAVVDAAPLRRCEKVRYCSDEANIKTAKLRIDRCLPNEVATGSCTMECGNDVTETKVMCLPRARVTCVEGARLASSALSHSCKFETLSVPCSLDMTRYPIEREECEKHCPGANRCNIDVAVKPSKLYCSSFCGVGRLPEGIADLPAPTTAEAYFQAAASMEHAAVHAFERLAAELTAWNAPAGLIDRARFAANDERRHARHMARLGGGPIASGPRLPAHVRPLLELALENAAEGAVRETLGALVMTHQSQHAEAPAVRAVLAEVAAEETEHAELSWDVLRWSLAHLATHDRSAVLAHARAAMDDIDGSVPSLRADARAAVGLPTTTELARMRRLLFGEIERAFTDMSTVCA